jgi:glycosyltransferase involved in cell wall biosynthesis
MSNILIVGPMPPLYSFGGPVRSISNMANVLSIDNEVAVISPSKNLNGKIDKKALSYSNDTLKVIYSKDTVQTVSKMLSNTDLLWINSFFVYETLVFLFQVLYKKKLLIISPRGQLNQKALSLGKKHFKQIFITVFKLFHRKVVFHATSSEERLDIERLFPRSDVHCIPNLSMLKPNINKVNSKKIVFFSRITPKKGLLELLHHMSELDSDYSLDIYGFSEPKDKAYWENCEKLIKLNPKVSFCGSIDDGDFSFLAKKYTFFIFPSFNENYGHVIIESLSVGLIPILKNGNTPFSDVIGEDIGLNFEFGDLKGIIERINLLNEYDLEKLKIDSMSLFYKFIKEEDKVKDKYLQMTNSIIDSKL